MKKRLAAIVVILCVTAILCVATGIIKHIFFRPYAKSVTVEGIRMGLANEIYVKSGEQFYLIAPSSETEELLRLDSWEMTGAEPTGEPTVILRLAELWVVELHPDGQAGVYDGYVASKERSSAFYSIPGDVAENINEYIGEKGKQPGGNVSQSMFRH